MENIQRIETFTSDSEFVQALQQKYGSIDASKVQTRRRQYYSFVNYPLAGSARLQFFSTPVGQSNRQLTNIQQAGTLDNPFLLKAIRTSYFIQDSGLNTAAANDATSLFSDFVQGLFQVGVMIFKIGSKEWLDLPSPFLYAPPAYGRGHVLSASAGVATQPTPVPYADLQEGRQAAFLMSPSVLINQDQNFQLTIEYPTGLVPVIGTGVVTSPANPLFVGVEFDGIEVRPLQ